MAPSWQKSRDQLLFMLRNYFKTALRNLLREKTSTFLNLAGLTLGIGCSIILFLIISYHKSFDAFHTKRDRIYRIVNQSQGSNGTDYQPGVPAVFPDAFRMDFPEAEEVVFTSYRASSLVSIPQRQGPSKKFQEERGVVMSEPSFFKIFDRNIVHGHSAGLQNPNEAVISTELARKYFGRDDVLGEIVEYDNSQYKISGVMENSPSNTDLPFELILSYVTVKKEREEQGWNSTWSDEQCYFLLKEGTSVSQVEARLPAFTKKYRENDMRKNAYFAQPLSELHFDDRYEAYSYSTVPTGVLFALSILAGILILTACINFINLATAEAIKRSKEVGVRKTMGSSRSQLVFQFLGETTLVCSLAVVAALGLSQIALSFLNPFLELDLVLDFARDMKLLLFVLGVTALVSILSGLYPAFVVSGFKPALALKNQINNRSSSGYFLRSGLVVVQFFISQFFIIGTIVLIKQTSFLQQKDLGFNKEAIIMLQMPEVSGEDIIALTEKRRTLRNEVLQIPGVENVTMANTPPSSGSVSMTTFNIEGDDTEYVTQVKQIDGNYLDLFDLQLIEGKNIGDLDSANAYIVNEKFARMVGYENPGEVVGKIVTVWDRRYPVVGVVKDFHTVSLENDIEPTVLFNNRRGYRMLNVKVNMSRISEVIPVIQSKWERAFPDQVFEYEFLDEHIREFYDGSRRMTTLLIVFTSMAIFIGCLGLFGLATFMANQKTKEIGVRKVLGASVESIILMFTREYAKLILIGFVIAAPLGYLAMQQFLNEFAYKIPLGPWIFLLGLGITFLVAMITVGYKSFRAAVVNPVKALRYE